MQPTIKYVDLQLNGYAGADFNSDATGAEPVHDACLRLREDGVAGILATFITDAPDRMAARLRRIAAIRRDDSLIRDVIWGVHLEGPFINPLDGYVGAHPTRYIQEANVEFMRRLLDAAEGLTRLVTLAPECDPVLRLTRFFARRGVLVSAGHCNPSLDELRGDGQRPIDVYPPGERAPSAATRHDNIIQRVLSLRDQLTICFIADGVHVPYPTLGNYLALVGMERAIVVTDGISAAGLGPGPYTIGSQTVNVGNV